MGLGGFMGLRILGLVAKEGREKAVMIRTGVKVGT